MKKLQEKSSIVSFYMWLLKCSLGNNDLQISKNMQLCVRVKIVLRTYMSSPSSAWKSTLHLCAKCQTQPANFLLSDAWIAASKLLYKQGYNKMRYTAFPRRVPYTTSEDCVFFTCCDANWCRTVHSIII